jgi:hypothetical protein
MPVSKSLLHLNQFVPKTTERHKFP